MNKKQAVFLRRYSALMGTPMKDLKRRWYATPRNRRFALKKQFAAEVQKVYKQMGR